MAETITIIGAGIGGLTTAITLKQRGLEVKVFESSPEIKPVGAGIILANNAMQVLKQLGIHKKIEAAGNRISRLNITDASLNSLSEVDLTEFETRYGVHNIAIHRGELQKILANELGFENIHLSKKLTQIEKGENFKLTFDDKSTIESKIVIGADGIKSVVRNQLFEKSSIRNAQQNCWRGVCDLKLSEKYNNEANESWGKGKRFGFVKISSQKVYWFALTNANIKIEVPHNLLDIFKEFHPDILEIIAATPQDQIIFSDIIDLKPIKTWQKENVCLIGDAAHATTPNLGQGACQAIEDAYVLGKLLDKGIALENSFKLYENLRRKKAHKIVNTSWTLGKIAQLENNTLIMLRNLALKHTPQYLNKKQLDEIFNIK